MEELRYRPNSPNFLDHHVKGIFNMEEGKGVQLVAAHHTRGQFKGKTILYTDTISYWSETVEDLIEDLKWEVQENGLKVARFNTIESIAFSRPFMDAIIELKVPFISAKESGFSKSLSDSYLYFADKIAQAKAEPDSHIRALASKNKETAKEFRENIRPIIEELQQKGFNSPWEIAKELTRLEVKTSRGKTTWMHSSVANLLGKLEDDKSLKP